ncbi:GTP pyrophosphokinase [Thalassospira xiamenensis]|uniref:GTP pyrophosphokinase n=1 Tax=Thalassospira xiamenensis TaxID=220697 RepID=UPI003AA94792
MSGFDEKIGEVIDFFESKEIDRLGKLVRFVTAKLEQELSHKGILARVSSRVKSSQSLRGKLIKWSKDAEKKRKFEGSPEVVLSGVSDLAAARIMTYTEQDREAVVGIIKSIFSTPHGYSVDFDLERKEEHIRIRNNPRNHYRATHMMVSVHENDLQGDFANLKFDKCELQITSLLAHVWNEIEHDTVYKSLSGELSEAERDAIDSLGHLTKTGDNIIQSLLHSREIRERQERLNYDIESDKFYDEFSLSQFLESHFGPKINNVPMDYYSGVSELLSVLVALGWNHPNEVSIHFSPYSLINARNETMALARFLNKNNRTRPNISACTCDLFVVAAIIKKKIELQNKFSDTHRNKREVAILFVFAEKNG